MSLCAVQVAIRDSLPDSSPIECGLEASVLYLVALDGIYLSNISRSGLSVPVANIARRANSELLLLGAINGTTTTNVINEPICNCQTASNGHHQPP